MVYCSLLVLYLIHIKLSLFNCKGIVHRDIRWDNILRHNETWRLTDYEHSGRLGEVPTFQLYNWPSNVTEGYSKKCDLYLVGKLFDEFMLELSTAGRRIKERLTNQEFPNCESVLKDEWFKTEVCTQ